MKAAVKSCKVAESMPKSFGLMLNTQTEPDDDSKLHGCGRLVNKQGTDFVFEGEPSTFKITPHGAEV